MSDADLMPVQMTDCTLCQGTGRFFVPEDMRTAFRCVCPAGKQVPGTWVVHAHEHAQRQVRSNGRVAWVDEGLALLVRQAWNNGIWTAYSCQGDARYEDGLHLVQQGYLVVIDQRQASALLRLWEWDLPGLLYLDYAVERPAARWEGSVSLRFSSVACLTQTRDAIRRGVFEEEAH